jgi:hypothetical protein
MPSHWGHKISGVERVRQVESPTGTQFLQGVGGAEAGMRTPITSRLAQPY